MQLARVFLANGRHPDHAPHFLLAQAVPDQELHQTVEIEPVGLRPPSTSIHLDAGRVHDHIVDISVSQEAVQPDAIAAGFVAAHYRCICGQIEAPLGLGDLEL
jgi:hypothetical protein